MGLKFQKVNDQNNPSHDASIGEDSRWYCNKLGDGTSFYEGILCNFNGQLRETSFVFL